MDITSETIAAAMVKGRGDKREVVGQNKFASSTGCGLSIVVCASEYCGWAQQHCCHDACNVVCFRGIVEGHSTTAVMTPVM